MARLAAALAAGLLLEPGRVQRGGAELSRSTASGRLYILVCQWRFLRRDFDALCDNLLFILLEIVICYGLMLAFNYLLGVLMLGLSSVLGSTRQSFWQQPQQRRGHGALRAGPRHGGGPAIFLAPMVEELIFRGGVFGFCAPQPAAGLSRQHALFALYHVWPYAVHDPLNWLFLLQYLPISYLLCRCYERSNSIWAGIFLHMLVNFIC